MRLRLVLGLISLLLLSRNVLAAVLVTPDGSGDYPTIQAAIDATADGDTVLLADGTFTGDGNREIHFLGKAIVLRSMSGDANSCVLDLEGSESTPRTGMHFVAMEVSTTAVEDITIRNAWTDQAGGAVRAVGGEPTLRGIRFVDNGGTGGGSAVYAHGIDRLRMVECTFEGNTGQAVVQAATSADDDPPVELSIDRCTFANNPTTCVRNWTEGGGAEILNSTFATNAACFVLGYQNRGTVSGCMFYGNTSVGGLENGEDDHGWLDLRSCVLTGNGGGVYVRGGGIGVSDCDFISTAGGVSDCCEAYLGVSDSRFVDSGGVSASGLTATITGCLFVRSGGIRARTTLSTDIVDCEFYDNTGGLGGGCYTRPGFGGPVRIEGCIFQGNVADSGGAIFSAGGYTEVVDCTFVENEAVSGSHIFSSNSDLSLNRCILAYGIGGRAFETDCLPPWIYPIVENTDIFGNPGGDWDSECLEDLLGNDGNISLPPRFCDWTHGDISLAADSPCVGWGALGVGCDQPAPANFVVEPDGSSVFPTIQAAIDIAADQDTVSLADGVFRGTGNRDIDFGGKSIVVRSGSGESEGCMIDCEGSPADPHRGFVFVSGETSSSVLQELTIQNGAAFGQGVERFGGAIYCSGSSPTIRGCILEGNSAERNGGAINLFDSRARIEDCIIRGNGAPLGGGINSSSSSPEIIDTQITGNYAAEGGGGFRIFGQSDGLPVLSGSTIAANRSELGGGILCASACSLDVSNTIVWDNCATDGPGFLLADAEARVVLRCSDLAPGSVSLASGAIFDTGSGDNIDLDPLFCDALDCLDAPSALGGFTLDAASPCLEGASACDRIGAHGQGCDVVSGAPQPATIPTHLSLSAGPNPFTDRVGLRLTVPEGPLEVLVFDVSGQRIRTLISAGHYAPGEYSIEWDGTKDGGETVPSGIYFCRATAGEETRTARLVSLRR